MWKYALARFLIFMYTNKKPATSLFSNHAWSEPFVVFDFGELEFFFGIRIDV